MQVIILAPWRKLAEQEARVSNMRKHSPPLKVREAISKRFYKMRIYG